MFVFQVCVTDDSARMTIFLSFVLLLLFFFSGIALFVMNRPDAKNAMSKNFLRMVGVTNEILIIKY